MTGALGRRVGAGALWSAANASVLRFINFSVNILVARLVPPRASGAFAIAMTISTIVGSLNDIGVSSAIVREPKRTPEIAPTVFTIAFATSVLLTALMIGAAPALADAFGSVDATGAVRVLALTVLLSSVVAVPNALMSRDYMQRQQLMADAAFLVVSTIVMVALVRMGHPVMGLAISRVAGQLVSVVMRVRMAPERYRPGFDRREAKALLSFGIPLVISNMIVLLTMNIVFIVVGHVLGAKMLGFYNLAFNIAGWPVNVFSAVLISVTLPTLSRVRDSPLELTRHLEAGLSAVSAAAFPVSALFIALPLPLIVSIYGPRWHPAWTALVVLAIFGASQTVLILFSDLIIALGMTRRLLAIRSVWIMVLLPTMIFCVKKWGIVGAGIAHASVIIVVVVPYYLLTVRGRTPVGLRWIYTSLGRPLFASVGVALAAFGAAMTVRHAVLQLFVGLLAGVAAYVLLAGRWLRTLLQQLREMYWSQKPDDVPGTGGEPGLSGGGVECKDPPELANGGLPV